ncbi:MAG: lysostaphin resistance A-like protein [Pirellula sp.]|jgi:membrane protease YdiL (CAAX protease family)|nr:CPBP family intramembrane metalloprotease [Pirellula sp.]
MNQGKQLFFAAMFELSLGLLAVGLGNVWGSHPNTLIPEPTDLVGLSVGVFGGLALGMAMAIAMLCLEKIQWAWIQETATVAEKNLSELLNNCSVFQMIALSLAAGVGEEMLFRGWLQGTLVEQWQPTFGATGVCIAIVLSSAVFGFAHPLSRGYIAIAFFLGLVLGGFAWCCNNVLIAIMAHATYDAVLMLVFASKWTRRTS